MHAESVAPQEQPAPYSCHYHLESHMKTTTKLIGLIALLFFFNPSAFAQGTAFTYQGRLNVAGAAANGLYDFQFQAFDGPNAVNNAVSLLIPVNAVPVTNGLFTTTIDFGGGVFTGPARWLQINVASNTVSPKVSLSPRQQLTPTPYSIFAATSATVTNGAITSAQLANGAVGTAQIQGNAINSGQIASGQVVKTVNGLTDNVTLSAGGNITITPSGNTLQFSAPNTGGWGLTGNSGTSPGANYVGTSDNQPFEAHVNGVRALRLEPTLNNSANTNLVNVIGGSPANFVTPGVRGATIGGGGAVYYFGQPCVNSVTGDLGTVSGGQNNIAASESFVGGGQQNSATGVYAAISGGEGNLASGSTSFVGGGSGNQATLNYSAVAGGSQNLCLNNFGIIGGGYNNYIQQTAEGGAILGGENNLIWTNSNNSFIGAGVSNQIIGAYSAIPGGLYNHVTGNYSFAAGYGARSLASGTFTWTDPSTGLKNAQSVSNSFYVLSGNDIFMQGGLGVYLSGASSALQMDSVTGTLLAAPNSQIQMQPSGEVDIFSQLHPVGAGVYIAAGGSGWNSLSDRNVKENFTDINARDVLEKIAQMPISTWNYKSQKQSIRHIGPMAQDFHAAFAVGEDDKHINNLDEEGVALAAIQGLNQKLEEARAENAELKARLDKLEQLLNSRLKGGER
jgi:hypothetical protein